MNKWVGASAAVHFHSDSLISILLDLLLASMLFSGERFYPSFLSSIWHRNRAYRPAGTGCSLVSQFHILYDESGTEVISREISSVATKLTGTQARDTRIAVLCGIPD
jgi:hypothetical protein